MATSFAEHERASLQQLSEAVARVSALRTSAPPHEHARPPLSRSDQAELLKNIRTRCDQAVLLVRAYGSTGAHAGEAARKAAAWGIVGTTLAAVALAIVAVLVTVFTFGASAAAAVAAIEAQLGFLATAARRGHPLAGDLSTILASMGAALRDVLGTDERPDAAAIARFLASTDDALARLERLSHRTAAVTGSCDGDPRAVFATGRELGESLNGLAALLRQRATAHVDTTAVAEGLDTLQRATGTAVHTLVPRS